MEENMLPNIIEHSMQVMHVAESLLKNLKDEVRLDRELIIVSALLHDITKTESLETKEPHDITGADFIRKLNYHDVADIIREHVFFHEGMAFIFCW